MFCLSWGEKGGVTWLSRNLVNLNFWSRQKCCVNIKEKCVHEKEKKKRKRRKERKNKNRISCRNQGVDCLSPRVCLEFKGNFVNLSFECK